MSKRMKKLLIATLSLAASGTAQSNDDWGSGIEPYIDLYLSEKSDLHMYGLDSACGKYLTIQTNNIPTKSNHFTITWAYELSKSGDILEKWPIPNDTFIYSVSGSVLTVSTSDENQPLLNINTSSRVKRSYEAKSVTNKLQFQKCPDKDQAYEACVLVKDLESNKQRIITALSACT